MTTEAPALRQIQSGGDCAAIRAEARGAAETWLVLRDKRPYSVEDVHDMALLAVAHRRKRVQRETGRDYVDRPAIGEAIFVAAFLDGVVFGLTDGEAS